MSDHVPNCQLPADHKGMCLSAWGTQKLRPLKVTKTKQNGAEVETVERYFEPEPKKP